MSCTISLPYTGNIPPIHLLTTMRASMDLTGKHILVIEDEYYIAADLRDALVAEGVDVIGPTGNLAAGLDLAALPALDAALLDINLDGEASFPIARQLRAANVPILFLTGYDDWTMPAEYRDVPRVAKPFDMRRVLIALDDLIHRRTPA